jgi:acetylornithine/N-succinyldiaminopimelate aminotransferase
VLDVVLAPDFLPRVQKVANYAKQQLGSLIAEYPDVFEDVRGQGLMLGLKMKVPNTEFLDALRARHMLAVGAGANVIRLLPPLIIDESHVREAVKLLGETAAQFQKKAAAE